MRLMLLGLVLVRTAHAAETALKFTLCLSKIQIKKILDHFSSQRCAGSRLPSCSYALQSRWFPRLLVWGKEGQGAAGKLLRPYSNAKIRVLYHPKKDKNWLGATGKSDLIFILFMTSSFFPGYINILLDDSSRILEAELKSVMVRTCH